MQRSEFAEHDLKHDDIDKLIDRISSASPSRRSLLGRLGLLGAGMAALQVFPLSLLEACGSGVSYRLDLFAQIEMIPTVPQPLPFAVQTVATATVATAASGAIPDYFMGLSYEKGDFVTESLFTAAESTLAGLFNRLGNGVLRIGGNSSDLTVWNADGPGNTPGQVSPVDVKNLAGFLALTQWKLLYTINLATSTPELAAAEAAYVQSVLGDVLLGFEIGNEPDEYGLSYFPNGWDLAAYETLWGTFRSAIVASTPSAVIVGPDAGGNVTTWTVPFATGPAAKTISLLTQHYYRGNGHSANATLKNLVSPDTTIVTNCAALQAAATELKIPFRFSETNSYLYGGSPGVSNAYASALWVIDDLFDVAYGGGSGVNLQGGDVGYYTPITNDGSTILGASPEYYGLLLFSLVGQGELLETTFSNQNFSATVYAVRTATGAIRILVNNKEQFQSLKLTVDCGRAISKGVLIEMTGPSLGATTGQMLQGETVAVDGSITPGTPYAPVSLSSSLVTFYVPAISAVLIEVN